MRLTTALYFTPSGRSIQDNGISPDRVVEALKDQQISGGMMIRESTLRGAFKNPGALNQNEETKPPAVRSETYSPPIKADLIGAADDSQLKAALAYVEGQMTTPANPAKAYPGGGGTRANNAGKSRRWRRLGLRHENSAACLTGRS